MSNLTEKQLQEKREAFYETIVSKVKAHGFTLIGILPKEGDPDPTTFTYSVGLATYGGYEYLVAGLSPTLAQSVIENVYSRLLTHWRPSHNVVSYEIANLPVRFQLMTDEHEANTTKWFWGNKGIKFKVLQIVWSDQEGNLPGEEDFNPGPNNIFLTSQLIPGSTL